MQTKLRSTDKNVAAKRIHKAQIWHKDGIGRWEGGYSWEYVLQYHDPNTTPSPNPNERKSWECCHIEFLLIIHVTKMLLGIYI